MTTIEYIKVTIDRLPKGYVFTYDDFINDVHNKETIIKSLNRLVLSGKIKKISKGKYYKPEETIFGTLQPNQVQVVKDLLEKNGKQIGYLTGISIYNKLGLSTQISNTIQIGTTELRFSFKRGSYNISFIRQKNTITKKNIFLLQILDVIRYIKKIPDITVKSACKRLLVIVKELSKEEKITIVRLARKYPPATRALLGALLEETGNNLLAEPLKRTLNPITIYKLPEAGKVLSTSQNWNIK